MHGAEGFTNVCSCGAILGPVEDEGRLRWLSALHLDPERLRFSPSEFTELVLEPLNMALGRLEEDDEDVTMHLKMATALAEASYRLNAAGVVDVTRSDPEPCGVTS